MAKHMGSALADGTTCHSIRRIAPVRTDHLKASHSMMRLLNEALAVGDDDRIHIGLFQYTPVIRVSLSWLYSCTSDT